MESFKNQKRFYEFIEKNIEEVLFVTTMWSNYSYPKPLNYMSITLNNKRFPNCGETSLLNFFNSMLYDPRTQTISMEKVKSIDKEIGSPLQKFYSKYPHPKSHSRRIVHEEFARIVTSGHEDIKYNKNGDISSSHNAFLGFQNINNLIPKITNKNGIHDLIRFLDNNASPTPPPEKKTTDSYKLEINDKLTWEFASGHFNFELAIEEKLNDNHITKEIFNKANFIQRNIIKTLALFQEKDDFFTDTHPELLHIEDPNNIDLPIGRFFYKMNNKSTITKNHYLKHINPIGDQHLEELFFEDFFAARDKELEDIFLSLANKSSVFKEGLARLEFLNQYYKQIDEKCQL